jgi:UDP-glucose 4-epimerase
LIPLIIQAAQGQRDSIAVFGTDYDTPDGTCVRDYIHIQDLADAHLKAMAYLRDGNASDIANLGNSEGNSVLEVIETVKRVTQSDFNVKKTARRAGDADKLVASSEKARKLLGWVPRKGDIETIVKDAWAWARVHPNGYEHRG